MNDILRYMSEDPVHRKYHHADLTFGMLYAYSENFVLPLSHDEVVHGKGSLLSKMPGDEWQRFANLRLLLAYMYTFPGKKLLFMGGEVGQWQEWDYRGSVAWACLEYGPHRGVQSLVRDLNGFYRRHAALHASDSDPAGFAWVDCQDVEGSTLAYERWAPGGDGLVVVCNFTPVPRSGYRVGMPRPGRWLEVMNTDAAEYGGSGLGNAGAVTADATAWHGRRWSAELAIPPLAVLVLRPDDAPPA
jgi:1,4-alpha-glucan branching enzyme